MSAVAGAVALLLANSVLAKDAPATGDTSFNPPVDQVCVEAAADTHIGRVTTDAQALHVDKALLASWALDFFGIPRAYEDAAAKRPDLWISPALTPRMEILADENFCKTKSNPAGKFTCKDADATTIRNARQGFHIWLTGDDPNQTHIYIRTAISTTRPNAFFQDPSSVMGCVAKKDETPHPTDGSSPKPYSVLAHLRVRGTTDGLQYGKNDDGFKAASGASFSVTRDDVADKTTDKAVGVVGYELVGWSDSSKDFNLIPYFGVNRNLTSVRAKGDTVTANTRDVGAYVGFSFANTQMDNVFTLRPDYLSDLQHHDHIESVNAVYQPVVPHWLNSYVSVIPSNPDFASIMAVADLRVDEGRYNGCGVLSNAQCASYTRIGSQFGISATSNNPSQPLTFTATDTRLIGNTDRAHDIDYLKFVLSYAINKDKNLSIDLSYSDGRREDTAMEEKLWGISIGIKY
jgi:hypothetical protein